MNLLKRAFGALAFVAMASALGGCVVIPVPVGHGYGGGYYHHDHR